MIEEESASLKQKKMEFEFEKATFSKQTEFAKNVLKKQDEEIKVMGAITGIAINECETMGVFLFIYLCNI